MPFLVTRPQHHGGKLYIERAADGESYWVPGRAKATRFDEAKADAIAAEINRYASVECQVEGVKADERQEAA